MFYFFKLIRIPNLAFIAVLQLLMRQAVLVPILRCFGFEVGNETDLIYLLIASTLFIAAGGYVINDYFDIKIDLINRPEKQIVGKVYSRQTAMLMHQILTGIGVVLGLSLAYITRSFSLAFIFIVVPGLLWFYSASYKRQFMVGNVVVAFLAALTVLIVAISELAFLEKVYGKLIYDTRIPQYIYEWIGGFSAFAFICTWIREIIKDLQDEMGDREMECRTMPIRWGVAKTKLFLYLLIIITLSGLFFINAFYITFPGTLSIRYIIFGLAFPFVALTYLLFTATSPSDYKQAATLTKIIMLVGVMYSFIFYYLLAKRAGISIFNLFLVQ
jgi:4-hydroxybenzoate polyprenyltransferase